VPISIVFIITTIGSGGAEGMLYRLLSRLDRTRFTASVISLVDQGATPLVEKIQALGIPIRMLGMQSGRPNPMSVLRLARWLRKDPPDLISTWQYHADLIGGLAARIAGGIPIAWGIRQTDLSREGTGLLTLLTVRMCASLSRWLPDRIVCCSEAARQVHSGLGYAADKMLVIHNGYDLELFKPDPEARESVRHELQIPRDAPVIGLVARFHPQKDHRNFLHAAKTVLEDRPDVHFVLFGHEVHWENEVLVRWIEEAGIRRRVHLLGRREDIARLTAAFDVACMSSAYGEGFPNIVSEAMSCGVPCAVTDVGEAAFIVGETGKIVQPRNATALAAALRALLALESGERTKLGMAARQRVKTHFNLPHIVALYENLFQELACGSGLDSVGPPTRGGVQRMTHVAEDARF
jgi:glycosyltransferase involved in cell wall biosynthesis